MPKRKYGTWAGNVAKRHRPSISSRTLRRAANTIQRSWRRRKPSLRKKVSILSKLVHKTIENRQSQYAVDLTGEQLRGGWNRNHSFFGRTIGGDEDTGERVGNSITVMNATMKFIIQPDPTVEFGAYRMILVVPYTSSAILEIGDILANAGDDVLDTTTSFYQTNIGNGKKYKILMDKVVTVGMGSSLRPYYTFAYKFPIEKSGKVLTYADSVSQNPTNYNVHLFMISENGPTDTAFAHGGIGYRLKVRYKDA